MHDYPTEITRLTDRLERLEERFNALNAELDRRKRNDKYATRNNHANMIKELIILLKDRPDMASWDVATNESLYIVLRTYFRDAICLGPTVVTYDDVHRYKVMVGRALARLDYHVIDQSYDTTSDDQRAQGKRSTGRTRYWVLADTAHFATNYEWRSGNEMELIAKDRLNALIAPRIKRLKDHGWTDISITDYLGKFRRFPDPDLDEPEFEYPTDGSQSGLSFL